MKRYGIKDVWSEEAWNKDVWNEEVWNKNVWNEEVWNEEAWNEEVWNNETWNKEVWDVSLQCIQPLCGEYKGAILLGGKCLTQCR